MPVRRTRHRSPASPAALNKCQQHDRFQEHTNWTYLDAKGSGNRKGTHVITWYDNQRPNEEWCLEHVAGHPNSWFYFHPSYNLNLCMDVPGAHYRLGTQLVLWSCNGRQNQQFIVSDLITRGAYLIEPPASRIGQTLSACAAGIGNYVILDDPSVSGSEDSSCVWTIH